MNVNYRLISTGCLLLGVACHSTDAHDGPAATAGSGGQVSAGGAAGGSGSVAGGWSVAGGASAVGGSAGSGGSAGQASSTLALSVGPFATCAVGTDQVVKCVGRCGSVGQGGSRDKAPAGLHAVTVAVGRDFACAVLSAAGPSGAVQCWGGGAAATPPTLADASELTAGDQHACALGNQGAVTCWG